MAKQAVNCSDMLTSLLPEMSMMPGGQSKEGPVTENQLAETSRSPPTADSFGAADRGPTIQDQVDENGRGG
jgi:hypothetical protein